VTGSLVAHLVLPEGYDDPRRVSGGNVYDREVRAGLSGLGWTVVEHRVGDVWPLPRNGIGHAGSDRIDGAVERELNGIPDDRIVVVDGLLGDVAAPALVRHADRLRLVALVHMPEAPGRPPGDVLRAARLVIATSQATGAALTVERDVEPAGVLVAPPGVAPAEAASGTPSGGALLCVAAVCEPKGHDVLFSALAGLARRTARPWSCVCAGDLHRDPAFVERQRRGLADRGLTDRVHLVGTLAGRDLEQAYAEADLLVLPSRHEGYGMVVTEALARGLPVIATAVGGVPEALGHATGAQRPGILVPPGDDGALAAAVAGWLDDVELRQRLRAAALDRRAGLAGWAATVTAISAALTGLAAA
jgi:glycosyltransferase involved in cell wall biosynthesis